MKRSPLRRRARTKHQAANAEHAEYLFWVHQQPCAACGARQAIQAAHVGQGGTGMKHGSDAETIPLCGPHWVTNDDAIVVDLLACEVIPPAGHRLLAREVVPGCHAEHDGFFGHFKGWKLADYRKWNDHQIAVHRGLFEARAAGTWECPF